MATYVKNKSGAFKKVGDQSELPTKQRSEARMKSYTSATDARAWVNNMYENKQYIIDLMGTEAPKPNNQVGKFVPVDVLVKALMGNKDVDINRLKTIVKELDGFINTLKLNTKETAAFNKIRALYAAGDAVPVPRGKRGMPLTESTYGRTSSEVRARQSVVESSPRTSSESRLYSPRETVMPTSASEAGSGQQEHHPQHVQHTPRPRSRPRTPVHSSALDNSLSHRQEMRRESDSQSSRKTSSSSPTRYPSVQIESSHKDVQVGHSVTSAESQTQTVMKPKEVVHRAQQCLLEVVPLKSKSSTSSLKSKIPVPGPTGDVKSKLTQTPVTSYHDIQTVFDGDYINKCGDCERNLKTAREILEEMESMKKALDDRNYKLQMTENQLMKLQDELIDKEHIDEDIASMAAEIANLRKTGCKDELRIVSTELQLLKKYCQKLIYIKADNKKLKEENENLLNARGKVTNSVPCFGEHHQQLVNICANSNMRRLPSSLSDNDLRNKLQAKTTTLKEVSKQRDRLQSTVAKLEAKLKKYDALNEDINGLKERSKILDSVIEEKLGLERRLQRLSNMENEMISLKMRAEKAEELQRALENAQNKLLRLQEQRNEQLNPVQVIENASNVAALLDDLRYKSREAEVLRVDRDRMRVRLDELSHIEHQYKILQDKVRMLEVVQNERDIYKTKTIELSSIQDNYVSMREQADQVQKLSEERDSLLRKMGNLECVIGDQENEISRLVMHIERLSKGADQHQDKIKEIITELRSEIEIKNMIITNSETQLADVQTQLKRTIDILTKEKSSLKQQVAEADISCQVLKARLERLGKQLTDATVALEKERKTCYRYKAEVISLTEENAKLQEIAERMNDLTDAGKLESILRKSHAALQNAAHKLNSHDRSDRSIYTDISTNTRPFVRRHGSPRLNTVSSLITDIKNIPTRDYDLRDVPPNQEGDIPAVLAAQIDEVITETLRGGRMGRGVSAAQAIPTIEEEVEVKMERVEADKVPRVCRSAQYPLSVCRSSAARAIPTIEEEVEVKIEKDDKEVGADKIPRASRSGQYPMSVCRSSATQSIPTIEEEVEVETEKEDKEVEVVKTPHVSRSAQHPLSVCRSIPCRRQADTASRSVGDLDRALQPSREEHVQYECVSCVCRDIQTDKEFLDKEQSAPSFPIPPCRRVSFNEKIICVDNIKDQRRLQKLEDLGKLSLDNVTCVCKSVRNEICECLSNARNAVSEGQVVHSAAPRRNVDDEQEQDRSLQSNESESASVHRIFSAYSTDVSLVCECTQTSASQQAYVPADVPRKGAEKIDNQRGSQDLVNVGKLSFGKGTSGKEADGGDRRKGAKYAISESGLRRICVDNSREQRRLQELDDQGQLSMGSSVTCVCKNMQSKVCECLTGQKDGETSKICIDPESDQRRLLALEAEGKLSLESVTCVCMGGVRKVCTCDASSETGVPPCRRGLQGERNAICVDNIHDLQMLQELENLGTLSVGNIICACKGVQADECLCKDSFVSGARSGTGETVPPCRREFRDDRNAICVDNIDDQQRLQELEIRGTLSLNNIICVCKGVQADECLCKDSFVSGARSGTGEAVPPCRREFQGDRNAICIDNVDDQQRLQELETQGTLSLNNIICVCKGVQADECLCKDSFVSGARSGTGEAVPPCRREFRGDRNAICVDNIADQQRLQELEIRGTLSLQDIICVCKGIQADECLCKDVFTSVDGHKATIARSGTADYVPPCRRALHGDRNTVCIDNIDDIQRLQALESRGALSENIACVCRGVQVDECVCKDPSSRKDLQGARSAICVDNIYDQQRLQELENEGMLSLENIVCVCKGVQAKECLCKESFISDDVKEAQSAPVMTSRRSHRRSPQRRPSSIYSSSDNSEHQSPLQRLESEGVLSLDSIQCICQGVQVEVCECANIATSSPTFRSDPSGRRSVHIEVPSVSAETQSSVCNCREYGTSPSQKEFLYRKAVATNTRIKCDCIGTQVHTSEYTDTASSSADIRDPQPQVVKPEWEAGINKEVQSVVCECSTTGTNPIVGEPPCRKDLSSGAICVDNLQDQIKLQKLEDEGKLSLENIQCVCKGTHMEICDCRDAAASSVDIRGMVPKDTQVAYDYTDTATNPVKQESPDRRSVGSNVPGVDSQQRVQQLEDEGTLTLDNIECVCDGTQMEICEFIDTATSSPGLKEHTVKAISKETQSITRTGKDIATVTSKQVPSSPSLKEGLFKAISKETQAITCAGKEIATVTSKEILRDTDRLQRFDDEARLSCRGIQATEVCECRYITTSAINLREPATMVTGSAESGKYESLDVATSSPQKIDLPPCRESQNDVGTICVKTEERLLQLRGLDMASKMCLASAACTSKYTQSKICQCVSEAVSVASFDAPEDKKTFRDQEIQPIPTDVTCVCKGVQHEKCECKNVGIQKDDPQLQKELKDLKMQHSAASLENKALRKHASELKEVAKNQITALSNELKKSRENWAITDDSKAMADLQEQNKLLQDEVERLKQLQCECSAKQEELLRDEVEILEKLQCECSEKHKGLLQDEVERLTQLLCECSEKHKEDIKAIGEKIPLSEEKIQALKVAGLSSQVPSETKPSEARVLSRQRSEIAELPSEEMLVSASVKHVEATRSSRALSEIQPSETRVISGQRSEISKPPSEEILVSASVKPVQATRSPQVLSEIKPSAARVLSGQRSEISKQPSEEMLGNASVKPVETILSSQVPSEIKPTEARALSGQRTEISKPPSEEMLLNATVMPVEATPSSRVLSEIKASEPRALSRQRSGISKSPSEEMLVNASAKPAEATRTSRVLSEIKPSEARALSRQRSEISKPPSQEVLISASVKPVQATRSYESKKAERQTPSSQILQGARYTYGDKPSSRASKEESGTHPSQVKRSLKPSEDREKLIEKGEVRDTETGKRPEQAEISEAGRPISSQKGLKQPSAVVTDADGTPKVIDYDKQPEVPKVKSYIGSKKPSGIKKLPSDINADDTKKGTEATIGLTDAPRDSRREPPKDRSPDDILGQQLQNCTDELDALRKQLADLKKQLADTKNDLEKERSLPKGDSSELDDLKKQLAALKNQLQDANKKLADCEQHLDDEKKKLDDEKKKSSAQLAEAKKQWEADKEKQKPVKSVSETQTIPVPTTTKGTETPTREEAGPSTEAKATTGPFAVPRGRNADIAASDSRPTDETKPVSGEPVSRDKDQSGVGESVKDGSKEEPASAVVPKETAGIAKVIPQTRDEAGPSAEAKAATGPFAVPRGRNADIAASDSRPTDEAKPVSGEPVSKDKDQSGVGQSGKDESKKEPKSTVVSKETAGIAKVTPQTPDAKPSKKPAETTVVPKETADIAKVTPQTSVVKSSEKLTETTVVPKETADIAKVTPQTSVAKSSEKPIETTVVPKETADIAKVTPQAAVAKSSEKPIETTVVPKETADIAKVTPQASVAKSSEKPIETTVVSKETADIAKVTPQTSVAKSSEKPVETTVTPKETADIAKVTPQTSVAKPGEKPVETSVEKTDDDLKEKLDAKAVDKQGVKPAEKLEEKEEEKKLVEKPSEKVEDKPSEKVEDKPVQKLDDKQAGKLGNKLGDKVGAKPVAAAGSKEQPDKEVEKGQASTVSGPKDKPSAYVAGQDTKDHPPTTADTDKPAVGAKASQPTSAVPGAKPGQGTAEQGKEESGSDTGPSKQAADKGKSTTPGVTAESTVGGPKDTSGPQGTDKPQPAIGTEAKPTAKLTTEAAGKVEPVERTDKKQPEVTIGPQATTEESEDKPVTGAGAKASTGVADVADGTKGQLDVSGKAKPVVDQPVSEGKQPDQIRQAEEAEQEPALADGEPGTAHEKPVTPGRAMGLALAAPGTKAGPKSTYQPAEKPYDGARGTQPSEKAPGDYKQKYEQQKQMLKASKQKLNELQNELNKTKLQSIESIRSAHSSYERDVMTMQEKYLEGIASLQASHEELIRQGNAELEAEIDSLREESVQKQAKIDELQCICFEQKKKKPALCQAQVQSMDIQMECVCDDMLFAYLLRKILYCGLESLTFDDLQYLHTKICDATAKVMGTMQKGDTTFGPCSCDPRSRQTHAQTQVAKLQMEVALERQRLESLKQALEIERTTQAAMTQLFQRQVKYRHAAYPSYHPNQVQTARSCMCSSENDVEHDIRFNSTI